MSRRPERRRRRRPPPAPEAPPPEDGTSLLRRTDVLIAVLFGGGVILAAVIAVVLSNRGGDDTPPAAPGATATAPPFSPVTEDEKAIQELSRLSIEVLPQGQWPSLYDSFTPEFQQRCPQEEFDRGGVQAAADLGSDLQLLRFKRLEQARISDTTASAVIVGEVEGKSEYSIQASFQQLDGVWKIAPAPNTQGCEAFSRLSG